MLSSLLIVDSPITKFDFVWLWNYQRALWVIQQIMHHEQWGCNQQNWCTWRWKFTDFANENEGMSRGHMENVFFTGKTFCFYGYFLKLFRIPEGNSHFNHVESTFGSSLSIILVFDDLHVWCPDFHFWLCMSSCRNLHCWCLNPKFMMASRWILIFEG